MNTTNLLETQLQSWAPRRPSARLKRALFGSDGTVASCHASRVTHHFSFAWLVPAAACALLMLAAFTQRGATSISRPAPAAMMAMIMSNQSYCAYLPGSFTAEQNALRNTFEWTNRRASTSSIGSFLPVKGTN
jgi:hypothetical protein